MKNSDLLKILPLLTEEQWAITQSWAERYKAEKLVEDETAAALLLIINNALGTKVPYKALRRSWVENAGKVAWFIESTFPKLRKVQRQAVLGLCVSLIMNDLKGRGVPVTFGTTWVNMVRVPEVVEAAFPGYRAAGMGKMILRAMQGK
jgi:hypothetical protein